MQEVNTPLKDSEIFDRAADLISKPGGWCTGRMHRKARGFRAYLAGTEYAYCAVGAIKSASATGDYDSLSRAEMDLLQRLSQIAFMHNIHPRWNDSQFRKSVVIKRLRNAAECCRQAERKEEKAAELARESQAENFIKCVPQTNVKQLESV